VFSMSQGGTSETVSTPGNSDPRNTFGQPYTSQPSGNPQTTGQPSTSQPSGNPQTTGQPSTSQPSGNLKLQVNH
jgi:hypothetical protein